MIEALGVKGRELRIKKLSRIDKIRKVKAFRSFCKTANDVFSLK